MSTAGKIAKFLGVWIVIPAGIGMAGYYFLAPVLLKGNPEIKERLAATSTADAPMAANTAQESPSRKFSKPQVRISISKAPPVERRAPRPAAIEEDTTPTDLTNDPVSPDAKPDRDRRRRRSEPQGDKPPEPEPANPTEEDGGSGGSTGDEGGSGGAADGGNEGTLQTP
ncbi:MAG: hypothetical protein JST40_12120 [Armatimonadetes bacterium]|nr:hypothetical protein [Armatimonadota bacterium]